MAVATTVAIEPLPNDWPVILEKPPQAVNNRTSTTETTPAAPYRPHGQPTSSAEIPTIRIEARVAALTESPDTRLFDRQAATGDYRFGAR